MYTKISRDIAAGETFTHRGPVWLQGNVGPGAQIRIEDGNIRISGFVGDGASVVRRPSNGGRTYVDKVEVDQGRILVDGVEGSETGITVDGPTGRCVTYISDYCVTLKGDAGAGLTVNAGIAFTADRVDRNARINAGAAMYISELGDNSLANSGAQAQVGKTGRGVVVNGGAVANVDAAGPGSTVSAGCNASAVLAHTTASVRAPLLKTIERTTGDESCFTLSPIRVAPAREENAPKPVRSGTNIKFRL